MNDRIRSIRMEERLYHEACYANHALFAQGSWLYKPVKTVMQTLAYFDSHSELTVLDLGCGVGRNSIPIAEALKGRDGRIDCVDLIPSALEKLMQYSHQHEVSSFIHPHLSDIAQFRIEQQTYDYIIAVSALEHLTSTEQLMQVLDEMIRGTKRRGIHCLIINTNIREIDMASQQELPPTIELLLTTSEANQLLDQMYAGWELLYTTIKPLQFTIERNGCSVLMTSDCLTYVAQQN